MKEPKYEEKTCKGGSITSKGYLPHLKVNGIQLPLKLDFSKSKDEDGFYPPLLRDGKYVYVLPNGKEYQVP